MLINATDMTWIGRTLRETGGAVRVGFPGVTAIIRFAGKSLAWRMSATTEDNFFDVSIDGQPFKVVQAAKGEQWLVLADKLTAGEHVVRVVRRTESWPGVVRIEAAEIDGELVSPPALPPRKLMFIGDSITAGAAVDCLPPDYPTGHIRGNANRSYGMELGRRLNAQVHLIAYGGRGLVRDYQGLLGHETPNAPMIFERSMPDEPDSRWDHSAYTPDLIVINLGTNDFAIGIPDERDWTQAYSAFIGRIREVHPAAHIVLGSSPMFSPRILNGDFARAAAMQHYLDEVVTLRQEAKDYGIEKLLHRHQPGTLKDSHPTWPQHVQMADDLEPVLRARLANLAPLPVGEAG